MLNCQFCNLARWGPDNIVHQFKSSYNGPFKDSYSHSIHTRFEMIASNEGKLQLCGAASNKIRTEISLLLLFSHIYLTIRNTVTILKRLRIWMQRWHINNENLSQSW